MREKRGTKEKAVAAVPEKKTKEATVHVDRASFQDVRVLQRNLLYVVGLPPSISKEETLRKKEYFGRFGRIVKIAVNRKPINPGDSTRVSYSAYVTFKRAQDAAEAMKSMTGVAVEGRVIRCTYGTTKYCSHFLRNQPCNNPACLYLHEVARPEDSYSKDDLTMAERFGVGSFAQQSTAPLHQPGAVAPASSSTTPPTTASSSSPSTAPLSAEPAQSTLLARSVSLPAQSSQKSSSAAPSPLPSPALAPAPSAAPPASFALNSNQYPPLAAKDELVGFV